MKAAEPLARPPRSMEVLRPLLVGPAAIALRAQMAAGWARAAVEHRMAPAVRPAPEAPAASFRDLAHRALGFAYRGGGDAGVGRGSETECQRGTQQECPRHSLLLVHGFWKRFPKTAREIHRDRFIRTRKTIASPPLTMAWQIGADRGLNNQVMGRSYSVCFARRTEAAFWRKRSCGHGGRAIRHSGGAAQSAEPGIPIRRPLTGDSRLAVEPFIGRRHRAGPIVGNPE